MTVNPVNASPVNFLRISRFILMLSNMMGGMTEVESECIRRFNTVKSLDLSWAPGEASTDGAGNTVLTFLLLLFLISVCVLVVFSVFGGLALAILYKQLLPISTPFPF